MASTNTINTRIQLKSDTESNWNTANNFLPLRGELIVYTPDDSHDFSRLKIGDGQNTINNLPFVANSQILVGTSAEWQNKYNSITPAGTLIIYTDTLKMKISDGSTPLIDLAFFGGDIQSHIEDAICHITNEERIRWDNKINCRDNVVDGTLIINRN